MPITKSTANAVVNHLVGRTLSVSIVSDVYLALSTTTPTTAGGNVTEPSGGGYSRKLIGGQGYAQFMGPAADGSSSNISELHFNKAQTAWGTITHVCLFSAATGGNLLAYGALTTSKTVAAGDVVVIETGDLSVLLS